jgi:hydrogenase maturation protein HypF
MPSDEKIQRFRIAVEGAVQGVGFRPFVYRLARIQGLTGWVSNENRGLIIEVEGPGASLKTFQERLLSDKPAVSRITKTRCIPLPCEFPAGGGDFEIRRSQAGGEKLSLVLPDLATCDACRNELFDPHNRRYRYPFINCTNCGPRYSIISALPYDRCHTTMAGFELCPPCRAEYENPTDRRFHAQPNACPSCGPQISLWDAQGNTIGQKEQALVQTVEELRNGKIIAFKGLGGFQLLVDATSTEAVDRLRQRKRRPAKPFALMVPSSTVVASFCELCPAEEELLKSPAAPIVLLRARPHARAIIAMDSIAPDNPNLGVMLPCSPLHELLMADLNIPVVATSGNLSQEPICIAEQEALLRLKGIADFFLVHDRPILRHVDDSVVRVVDGKPMVLRRARGYAPFPVTAETSSRAIMALGAHFKSSIAVAGPVGLLPSQHIGDLETERAFGAFQETARDLASLYNLEPTQMVADMHPDYLSTQYANEHGKTCLAVQHHYAHLLSCMADNDLQGEVLGLCWDGTGYGLDGSIWGGEFLLTTNEGFRRAGHLRTFSLVGGDAALREPRRSALGLLCEIHGWHALDLPLAPMVSFTVSERELLKQVVKKSLNCPRTSSAGRLFDGVAALLGLHQKTSFEGQAAMAMEFTAGPYNENQEAAPYPIEIVQQIDGVFMADWQPMLMALLADLSRGVATSLMASRFHDTLVAMGVETATRVGVKRVALSGGCWQNSLLMQRMGSALTHSGFEVYRHHEIPPNDGGIAVGQLMAALREKEK